MNQRLKTWIAMLLALVAGMLASELMTFWAEPDAQEIPQSVSIESPSTSPPKVAWRKHATPVRWEHE